MIYNLKPDCINFFEKKKGENLAKKIIINYLHNLNDETLAYFPNFCIHKELLGRRESH